MFIDLNHYHDFSVTFVLCVDVIFTINLYPIWMTQHASECKKGLYVKQACMYFVCKQNVTFIVKLCSMPDKIPSFTWNIPICVTLTICINVYNHTQHTSVIIYLAASFNPEYESSSGHYTRTWMYKSVLCVAVNVDIHYNSIPSADNYSLFYVQQLAISCFHTQWH